MSDGECRLSPLLRLTACRDIRPEAAFRSTAKSEFVDAIEADPLQKRLIVACDEKSTIKVPQSVL
jgi:hypothetical protein